MKFLRLIFIIALTFSLAGLSLSGCGSRGDAHQKSKNAGSGDSTAVDDSTASAEDSVAANADTSKALLDLIPVEVAPVQKGDMSQYLLLSATIETENAADVCPLVGGIIKSIAVEEGMRVDENQPPLQLEDDDIVLNEKKADVDYEQQKTAFARLEKMHEQALISDEEFENARFDLKQAEIARDKAHLTRQRTTIRSPITGIVTQRLVQEGNLVTNTTKLFVITDPNEKICRVYVPERDLRQLQTGQKVYVTSQVMPQNRLTGWIKRISPVVDPGTGTCKVTIGLKDPQNVLRPGMFVRNEIVIDTHRDAVIAPKNALLYENDLEWVYVVEDTLAVKKQVKIGFSNGSRFEALDGLKWGDRVVVGQNALKDSSGVRVVSLDSTLAAALSDTSSSAN